jgi:macrolide-specific efflux system membrane fusion protein
MTAQVFFVAQQAQDTLTVPTAALQPGSRPQWQRAQIVAANGEIQARDVRTGISDRLRTQVLEGLVEGDHILSAPATGSGG